MERITFAGIPELAEYIISRVEDKEYIVATLFFNNAVELMRNLLAYENVQIGTVDIADATFDGYVDEYYVSLTDDYSLCVERASYNGKYIDAGDAYILIDGSAKHAIVTKNEDAECVEIVIGDDDCFFNTVEPEHKHDNKVSELKRGHRSLLNLLFK